MNDFQLSLLLQQDRFGIARVRAFGLVVSCVLVVSIAAAQTGTSGTAPSFDSVHQALGRYFATLKDYKHGDLLSQSRVADALAKVTDATGWDVPGRQAIVDRALPDNSFLVGQCSTPAGRAFMRNVSKYSGSYSRLDRLSTISGGQQFIKDLIARKGGSEMIEYLATTRGGHELGKMMSGVQQGVDLNKPTGRIYTAGDLLVELKRAYRETSQ
jgi:hypothetical protein